MKKILLSALLGLGVLASQPSLAQVSASSRITSTDSNLMLHVREARSESGLAPAVQAKVGPVSYSSKEGFGLNVATVEVCADSLTGELPFALPPSCQYNPTAFYPSLPATITVDEAQAQLNGYFASNKNAMAGYLRGIIKQNKTASAWYTFEAPLTVSFYTTTSSTDADGNVTYQTVSRQEERKVTWFLFADENGAAIAGNPRISDATPEIIEVIFFPSNSQRFLDEEEIELPLGQIKWRKINSTTGAPLSAFVTENVGAAYDMPVNADGLVQSGASVQPYVACLIKNDGCANSSALDVTDLLSREGASAAVVRYLTPAVISTFPISSTPNPDGTFDYREKVSLNVSSRVFDYQFSCVNPKYTNVGSYNVEMNSAMHTYTVNQGGEFNPLSASPFSFQAYLSNKTYTYETTYPAAQQSNLAGLIIDPLRSPQLASTTFYPGSIVAALEVRNKAEFCERPCGAGTVTWRHLGQANGQLCTATSPLVNHQGTRTVLATAENFSGSAQYRCDNGTLSQVNPASAQCVFTEPKKDCQSGTSLTWSVGSAQCTGTNSSTVSHGASTTISDAVSGSNSTDGEGTARYSCDDGTLSIVAGSQQCAVPVVNPPNSGGGSTTPPPTTTPEPPVVQPPVTPPVVIPDSTIPDGELGNEYTIFPPADLIPNLTVFGRDIGVEGDYVYTAGSTKNPTTGVFTHYLFAFKFNGSAYVEDGRIAVNDSPGTRLNSTASSNTGDSFFGGRIDAKAGTIILGSSSEHPVGGSERAGSYRIYQYNKSSRAFSLNVYNPGTQFTGSEGSAIATDGSYAASAQRFYSRAITVRSNSGGAWSATGTLSGFSREQFSVDLKNGVLVSAGSDFSESTNGFTVWDAASRVQVQRVNYGNVSSFNLLNGVTINLANNDGAGSMYGVLSDDASYLVIGKSGQRVGANASVGWYRVLRRVGGLYQPIADGVGQAASQNATAYFYANDRIVVKSGFLSPTYTAYRITSNGLQEIRSFSAPVVNNFSLYEDGDYGVFAWHVASFTSVADQHIRVRR